MHEVELITARGHGAWGPLEGDIELVQRRVTRRDFEGTREEVTETYELRFVHPDVAVRQFPSEDERAAFVHESFGDDMRMEHLDPPEEREIPPPLGELAGRTVVSVAFVRSDIELGFDDDQVPLRVHARPKLSVGDATLEPGDGGYYSALVDMIGETFTRCDQPLDHGFVLEFSATRLSLPREHPDGDWKAVAEYEGLEF